jgi:hypothetical protein
MTATSVVVTVQCGAVGLAPGSFGWISGNLEQTGLSYVAKYVLRTVHCTCTVTVHDSTAVG